MRIIGAFDVHRKQITFKWVDTETGEVQRGRILYAGLDITVYESADKRPPGHLSRQGPEALRWALYEAAQAAARSTSPDRAYYLEVKRRLNHKRACAAALSRPDLSLIMSPEVTSSVHPDKAGQPGAGFMLSWSSGGDRQSLITAEHLTVETRLPGLRRCSPDWPGSLCA